MSVEGLSIAAGVARSLRQRCLLPKIASICTRASIVGRAEVPTTRARGTPVRPYVLDGGEVQVPQVVDAFALTASSIVPDVLDDGSLDVLERLLGLLGTPPATSLPDAGRRRPVPEMLL